MRLETHAAARGRRADANCSDGNIFRVVFRFDRHFYCFRVNPKKRLGPPAVMSRCVRHGHAARRRCVRLFAPSGQEWNSSALYSGRVNEADIVATVSLRLTMREKRADLSLWALFAGPVLVLLTMEPVAVMWLIFSH